jgi:hypothetical protein
MCQEGSLHARHHVVAYQALIRLDGKKKTLRILRPFLIIRESNLSYPEQ